MKEWILARIKETSTWAGVATFVGSLSFIPLAEDWQATVTIVGTAIAGLVSVWVKETKTVTETK